MHDGWWANRSGVRLRACRDRPTGVAVCPSHRPVLISQRCGQRGSASPPLRGRQSDGCETDRRQVTALCVDRGNRAGPTADWNSCCSSKTHDCTAHPPEGDCEVAVDAIPTRCRLLFTSCRHCVVWLLSPLCLRLKPHAAETDFASAVRRDEPWPSRASFGLSSRDAGGGVQCCEMPSRFCKRWKMQHHAGGHGNRGQDPGEQGPSIPVPPHFASVCVFAGCLDFGGAQTERRLGESMVFLIAAMSMLRHRFPFLSSLARMRHDSRCFEDSLFTCFQVLPQSSCCPCWAFHRHKPPAFVEEKKSRKRVAFLPSFASRGSSSPRILQCTTKRERRHRLSPFPRLLFLFLAVEKA